HGERLPQTSSSPFQPAPCLGGGQAHFQHHQRHAQTAGSRERSLGLRRVRTGGLFEDSQASAAQFLIGHAEVHHPVIVNAPEADHGGSAEHVENKFLCRACLHA